MDVDQLPVMATQYPEDMNCMWHTFSMKGHWYYSPLLLAQTFFKYGADLCYRICQNKKRDEDAIEYTPKGRRAVQIMADKRAEAREKRLVDRELASARKYAHQRKLISRKLENEVRELDEWNSLRKQFAARIDGQFKKGEIRVFLFLFELEHHVVLHHYYDIFSLSFLVHVCMDGVSVT